MGFVAFVMFAPTALAQGTTNHFWLSNLEGQRFLSREAPGPIVLSFFFVDCVPCRTEIPELHKLMQKEFPRAALLFVDPVGDDSAERVKAFAATLGVPSALFYRDPLGRMASKHFDKQMLFPTIIVLRNGREQARVHGMTPDDQQVLRKALGT